MSAPSPDAPLSAEGEISIIPDLSALVAHDMSTCGISCVSLICLWASIHIANWPYHAWLRTHHHHHEPAATPHFAGFACDQSTFGVNLIRFWGAINGNGIVGGYGFTDTTDKSIMISIDPVSLQGTYNETGFRRFDLALDAACKLPSSLL